MNPNELPSTKAHATRWLVWSGVICLLLAGLCMATSFIVTFVGMGTSFHTLQNSSTGRYRSAGGA